jgi:NodT family efflux transporter outer membrane factor (OMF) lipoprotein
MSERAGIFGASLWALYLLTACSLAPAYERPQVALPASLDPSAPSAEVPPLSDTWWQSFSHPELDRLIAAAQANNRDLVAATYRIDQARSTLHGARAEFFPQLNASTSASRDFTRAANGLERASTESSAGTGAGYEVDLWGRVRNRLASQKANYEASVFDRAALRLVVETDVATSFAQLLAFKDRLAIARRNLEAARDILELVESQYRAGAISGLELAQQRAALAGFEADIPALTASLSATESALALLVGFPAQNFHPAGESLAELNLPQIAPQQPSLLLARRPDIARAEARLRAANADIGVARAAFFPSLDLSASLLFGDIISGGISRLASLGGQLAAPLFDGGRIQAEVDRTRARYGELQANYHQNILLALKEAYDALVLVESSRRQVDALTVAAEQAARALELAQLRYRYGAVGFQTVLEAQRTSLSAQDRLVQQNLQQFTAAISLYKALGGGWNAPARAADTQ